MHVVCALILYFFWFEKPAGVKDPTILDKKAAEILENLSPKSHEILIPANFRVRGQRLEKRLIERAETIPVVAYNYMAGYGYIAVFYILLILTSVVYGGIHLCGWNFIFPTEIEAYIWKISCVGSLATFFSLPSFVIFLSWYFYGDRSIIQIVRNRWEMMDIYQLVSMPIFIFGIISRVFLIVQSFLSLRGAVEGIYLVVPWTQFLPHI